MNKRYQVWRVGDNDRVIDTYDSFDEAMACCEKAEHAFANDADWVECFVFDTIERTIHYAGYDIATDTSN